MFYVVTRLSVGIKNKIQVGWGKKSGKWLNWSTILLHIGSMLNKGLENFVIGNAKFYIILYKVTPETS